MLTTEEKRANFRRLHESGCFVIPNPWDVGSAKLLAGLGFSALASSSSGFGFTIGAPDPAVPRDRVLQHLTELSNATDLPVNADYQSGYAATLDELKESVRQCVATGVSGLSIEDATGDPSRPLFEFEEAVERLAAAREAVDGTGALLIARAECFLVKHPDALNEAIRRLTAYAAAGADVLFAPGLQTREQIVALVEAVHPKPVNVLMHMNLGFTVDDLAEWGVRRISVGSALSRAALTGFLQAAQLLKEGSFKGFDGLKTFGEIYEVAGIG